MGEYMAKKEKQISNFSKVCSRFLVLVICVLVCLIVLKSNAGLKDKIYEKVFQKNFSFAKINETYKKYFGSSIPLKKEKQENAQIVSSIKLEYTKQEKYKDGVKLTVKPNYLVQSMDNGLVIFAGKKEEYGNTVIIQRPDNIEVWYSNLKNINVSLYDYIKKGTTLGEVDGTDLYVTFIKEGKPQNYQEYI